MLALSQLCKMPSVTKKKEKVKVILAVVGLYCFSKGSWSTFAKAEVAFTLCNRPHMHVWFCT